MTHVKVVILDSLLVSDDLLSFFLFAYAIGCPFSFPTKMYPNIMKQSIRQIAKITTDISPH